MFFGPNFRYHGSTQYMHPQKKQCLKSMTEVTEIPFALAVSQF